MTTREESAAPVVTVVSAPLLRVLPLRAAFVYNATRTPDDCVSPHDVAARHWVAVIGDVEVGCASLFRDPRTVGDVDVEWRLAQLGVSEPYRRHGVATRLIQARLNAVAAAGGTWAWAQARESALPVYQRAGARVISNSYTLPGTGAHRDVLYGPMER